MTTTTTTNQPTKESIMTTTTTTNKPNNSLGKYTHVKIVELPMWEKAKKKVADYYANLEQKTVGEVFGVKGNRNSLPFSTQVLGNIRLVNSGSIAQSYQSWRVKHPTGDISEWIVDNIYQLTADELKAQKEREQREQEVLKTATDLLSGLSLLGKPTIEQVETAKDTLVGKYGAEVFNKLIQLLSE